MRDKNYIRITISSSLSRSSSLSLHRGCWWNCHSHSNLAMLLKKSMHHLTSWTLSHLPLIAVAVEMLLLSAHTTTTTKQTKIKFFQFENELRVCVQLIRFVTWIEFFSFVVSWSARSFHHTHIHTHTDIHHGIGVVVDEKRAVVKWRVGPKNNTMHHHHILHTTTISPSIHSIRGKRKTETTTKVAVCVPIIIMWPCERCCCWLLLLLRLLWNVSERMHKTTLPHRAESITI